MDYKFPSVAFSQLTTIYVIIFLTGVIGNVIVCVVIVRHSTMHTATNYYLFSLAISDLMFLLMGTYVWNKHNFQYCVLTQRNAFYQAPTPNELFAKFLRRASLFRCSLWSSPLLAPISILVRVGVLQNSSVNLRSVSSSLRIPLFNQAHQ